MGVGFCLFCSVSKVIHCLVWGSEYCVFWDLHSLFSFWPFYCSLSTGFLERETVCVSRLCGIYRLYSTLNKGKMPKQKRRKKP